MSVRGDKCNLRLIVILFKRILHKESNREESLKVNNEKCHFREILNNRIFQKEVRKKVTVNFQFPPQFLHLLKNPRIYKRIFDLIING